MSLWPSPGSPFAAITDQPSRRAGAARRPQEQAREPLLHASLYLAIGSYKAYFSCYL